jgi:hypothetical protein
MAELQDAVLGEGLAERVHGPLIGWVPGLRLAVIVTANRSGPLGSGASTGVVVVNAAASTRPARRRGRRHVGTPAWAGLSHSPGFRTWILSS